MSSDSNNTRPTFAQVAQMIKKFGSVGWGTKQMTLLGQASVHKLMDVSTLLEGKTDLIRFVEKSYHTKPINSFSRDSFLARDDVTLSDPGKRKYFLGKLLQEDWFAGERAQELSLVCSDLVANSSLDSLESVIDESERFSSSLEVFSAIEWLIDNHNELPEEFRLNVKKSGNLFYVQNDGEYGLVTVTWLESSTDDSLRLKDGRAGWFISSGDVLSRVQTAGAQLYTVE